MTPEDVNFIEESKYGWLPEETNSWGNSRTTAEIIYIFMNSGNHGQLLKQISYDHLGRSGSGSADKTTGYLKQAVYSDKVNKSWVRLP
ncbi:hypothetical protein EJ377_18190 [Chryseobacterium arthrosphaerae]|uniref:Uncharacterized protein n=1 Tax=Chryseobacterium arthrosphaerae TaxID=651561 RepID=A0A3S0Q4L2_9FLAO|nr:hypothetical protein EJ377_18190 [Chryseobacterium arthrosphaerae]